MSIPTLTDRFTFRGTLLAFLTCALLPLSAQTIHPSRAQITTKIDETRLHRLAGNTRSQANAANDRGAVSGDLALDHVLLQLTRPADQEQALNGYIDQLHDPHSPNYQKWMSAAEFGKTFGPAESDIAAVTEWLKAKGLTVNSVYPSGMLIDFSGTAANVQTAFHTSIHYLNVNGETHLANMSDPQIPEALAPAVAGIVTLHDFSPRPMRKPRPQYTYTAQGSTYQAITPADLATIYNFTGAYSAGYTGKGQTIAVVEDADLYSANDWANFRTAFGLTSYSGTLVTAHPAAPGGVNCVDPGGNNGDDGEAALDSEWAGAAAPDATVMLASCSSTRTTFGGLIALQNLVNSANPPSIVSISYGECEAENGATANATYNKIYQQAVAEGISIFAAAGDQGAAACDSGEGATHGIGVSAFASTPYNVATGGTDFGDGLQNSTNLYWGSTNSSTYGSALSYVPEIPWNDSCAGSLLAGYLGFSAGYGANGLCSSSMAQSNGLVQVVAGSGGPSGCATGAPDNAGIVGGTCQGYAQPSWQTGVAGLPSNSVRNIPDVSMFAGTGVWGHYYVFCWSDRRQGGASCSGAPSNWAGAGGTSFTAPIMAGVQALINQKTGKAQGNPNYEYYKLAAQEYGSVGNATCTSSNGASAASSCTFYNVTQGDIAVDCAGSTECYGSTTSTQTFRGGRRGGGGGGQTVYANDGALSLSNDSFSAAYGTAAGWNFATGIGSVNVGNLVMNWGQ